GGNKRGRILIQIHICRRAAGQKSRKEIRRYVQMMTYGIKMTSDPGKLPATAAYHPAGGT
ncbi:hypothetical protein NK983_32930, partial [Salmonella enterica subsp. enterica serovar Typhimurium]|nr:hypothetical protein [Salmonella enterica subsp. enterica serovar Typhimurium]